MKSSLGFYFSTLLNGCSPQSAPAYGGKVNANYMINMFRTGEEPRCLRRGSSMKLIEKMKAKM